MQYKDTNKPMHMHIRDLFWYGTSQAIMHYDDEQIFCPKISLYSLNNDEGQVSRKHITTQWNWRDAKQLLMINWCRDHIILSEVILFKKRRSFSHTLLYLLLKHVPSPLAILTELSADFVDMKSSTDGQDRLFLSLYSWASELSSSHVECHMNCLSKISG